MHFRKLMILVVVSVVLSMCAVGSVIAQEEERAEVQELVVAPAYFAGTGFGAVDGGGDMSMLDPARRGNWSFHSLLWAVIISGLALPSSLGNLLAACISASATFWISLPGIPCLMRVTPTACPSSPRIF